MCRLPRSMGSGLRTAPRGSIRRCWAKNGSRTWKAGAASPRRSSAWSVTLREERGLDADFSWSEPTLAERELHARNTRGQPHRAGGVAADDVAQEMHAEIEARQPDREHENGSANDDGCAMAARRRPE